MTNAAFLSLAPSTQTGAVTPEQFGAAGNGLTDDTAAVQAAINYAWITGTTVLFAARPYLCGNLTLPTPDPDATTRILTLAGSGDNEIYDTYGSRFSYGTRLICSKTDGSTFINGIATTTTHEHPTYVFKNLALVGQDSGNKGSSSGNVSGTCLQLGGSNVTNVIMENVTISGFCAPGAVGLLLDNVEDSTFMNVSILHCDTCLKVGGVHAGSNANTFMGCCFQMGLTRGIWLDGTAGGQNLTGVFSGGVVQSNYKTGLYINGAAGFLFNGVHFENNNSSGSGTDHGIWLDGANNQFNQHIHFNACRYTGSSGHNDVYLSGLATGKNDHIVFNGGYNGGQITPLFTIADQYSQYVTIREICSSGAISDAGTATQIQYQNQTSPSAAPLHAHVAPEHGFLYWSGDPLAYNGTTAMVAGTIYLTKVMIPVGGRINTVSILTTAAGAALANCYVGIYDPTGAQLWASGDLSSSWGTGTGLKTTATGGVTVNSPFIWVALLANGTTPPTVIRLAGASGAAANANLSVATSRAATYTTTGQTTLPASFTPSTALSQGAIQMWAALS